MNKFQIVRQRNHNHRGNSASGGSSFPDATNTGVPAGTTLTPSGGFTTTANGQVIDALHVSGGRIDVIHDNVLIKRCKFTSPGGDAIVQNTQDYGATGMVIEDCEFDGTGNTGGQSAVAFGSLTMRRCNIHDYGEGLSANGDCLIEDNYMHDFGNFIAVGAHQDGIQAEFGSNITIRHNTILQNVDGANAAVSISLEQHAGIVIENNLMAGASFTCRCGGGGPNNNTDIRVRNNRISTMYYPNGGYFGPFSNTGGLIEFAGNVWHESGLPI